MELRNHLRGPDNAHFEVRPGYNPATQLFSCDLPDLPPIAAEPTRADALEALAQSLELVSDCPFVDEESRSVALSALITPVVRAAFPASPMHVFRTSAAGTKGKSYLVDIARRHILGHRLPGGGIAEGQRSTDPQAFDKVILAGAGRAYDAKAASIRAMMVGSSGLASAAATHSRSSARFLQPITTVSTSCIESA
jgi:hypothetical protein